MAFALAGLYGPEAILGVTGTPATSTPVTVYIHGTTTVASLYTDQTKGTAAANPVDTDSYGNLVFYAVPGLYDLSFTVGGVATTKTVLVEPWYTDIVSQGTAMLAWGGAGNPIVGALPSAADPVALFQVGSPGAVTTDVNGRYLASFPAAFPTGLLTVFATVDDVTGAQYRWVTDPSFGASASQIYLRLINTSNGASVASTTASLRYLAIGF